MTVRFVKKAVHGSFRPERPKPEARRGERGKCGYLGGASWVLKPTTQTPANQTGTVLSMLLQKAAMRSHSFHHVLNMPASCYYTNFASSYQVQKLAGSCDSWIHSRKSKTRLLLNERCLVQN